MLQLLQSNARRFSHSVTDIAVCHVLLRILNTPACVFFACGACTSRAHLCDTRARHAVLHLLQETRAAFRFRVTSFDHRISCGVAFAHPCLGLMQGCCICFDILVIHIALISLTARRALVSWREVTRCGKSLWLSQTLHSLLCRLAVRSQFMRCYTFATESIAGSSCVLTPSHINKTHI